MAFPPLAPAEFFYPALQPFVHYVPSGQNGIAEIDRYVGAPKLMASCMAAGHRDPDLVVAAALLADKCRPCSFPADAAAYRLVSCPCRVVQFLRDHDQLARRVAANGQRFAATHLVTEGRLCYVKVG